jgi:hypothetical protein
MASLPLFGRGSGTVSVATRIDWRGRLMVWTDSASSLELARTRRRSHRGGVRLVHRRALLDYSFAETSRLVVVDRMIEWFATYASGTVAAAYPNADESQVQLVVEVISADMDQPISIDLVSGREPAENRVDDAHKPHAEGSVCVLIVDTKCVGGSCVAAELDVVKDEEVALS